MAVRLTYEAIEQTLIFAYGSNYRIRTTPYKNSPISQKEIIEGVVAFQDHLKPHGILENRFRVMHFVAQGAHEAAQFRTLQEFASGQAYEGRTDLGNTQPGDGPRYKGHGIFMVTGRANHRTMGQLIGVDLEANPARAMEPEISVQTAGAYWTSRNINAVADDDEPDNIEAVTRKINGGMNGYNDRFDLFMAAGRVDWPLDETETPPGKVALKLSRDAALELQAELNRALR